VTLDAQREDGVPISERWVPIQAATRTFTCRAAGCTLEVKTDRGNGAYCAEHRVERKRSRAREAANGVDPALEPDGERIARGNEFVITAAKDNGQPAETPDRELTLSPTAGPFERCALELATAGRELDSLLREQVELKAKIGAAVQAWRAALEELPSATNGHAAD
jgi:hypothetical protein